MYEVNTFGTTHNPLKNRPHAYWHNVARIAAWRRANITDDAWILFIDADEIPDGATFRWWLNSQCLIPEVAYRFSNYWYFREPIYRAETVEYSPIMVHSTQLTEARLMHDMERHGITANMPEAVVMDPVMFHHFSWVRTEADMIRKVTSWGHCTDRDDWVAKVKTEFNRTFDPTVDTDFVHGYKYTTVPNTFNISLK
jgi:hypothetical protein